MSDRPSDPYVAPPVVDRSQKPPGVLPKHAQAWALGSIALVMVVVIALSGRSPAPARSSTIPAAGTAAIDPSAERIQEYRTRIEEQARKLAAEQAQLLQARQRVAAEAASTQLAADSGGAATVARGASSVGDGVESAASRERAAIAAEEVRRAYRARFAPNLALSLRKVSAATPSETGDSSLGPSASSTKATDDGQTDERKPSAQLESGRPTRETRYPLLEGTVIETVLTNRLDGSFSGPVNCMVTTPVYARDHSTLLIPRGTRVLGEVRKVETFGDQRLAVTFHRAILPNGQAVRLEKMPGLDQIGQTGVRDQVDHHYMQVFGVSLAIGAIAGLSQANTRYGTDASATDAYRQGVASSLSQTSLHILDRYLNILPTFTIREGQRVKVYLTGDLTLPAYRSNQIASDQ